MINNIYEILYTFQAKMYILMQECLMKDENRVQTLAKLMNLMQNELQYLNFNSEESRFCWNSIVKALNSVIVASNAAEKHSNSRLEAIYSSIYYKYTAKYGTRQEFYQLYNKYNGRIRQNTVNNLVQESQLHKNPLFLCSKHINSRVEHGDLQGKVYYDANFKLYLGEKESTEVENYIKKHHLMSIQEVTGAPYWLLTSPNCRHRMVNISLEDVKNHSTRSLLRLYHLSDSVYKTPKSNYYKHVDKVFYREIKKNVSNGLKTALKTK